MIKNFVLKKWETLIEITIAVATLTSILISMSKLLWNSKLSAKSSEKRMEAVALAKEWLEMFRYYREYNYMAFSDKKRICWNFLFDNWDWDNSYVDWVIDDNDSSCEESSTNTWSANYIIEDNKMYIPVQNLSDKNYWRFFLTTKWKNLSDIWKKKDNWNIFDDLKIFQLCENKDTGLIMSCESMWLPESKKKRLRYFRVLKFDYVDSLWQLCRDSSYSPWCDINTKKSLNEIKVTSTVIWVVWWSVQSVDLTTVFTDYEDRIDRES